MLQTLTFCEDYKVLCENESAERQPLVNRLSSVTDTMANREVSSITIMAPGQSEARDNST